VLRFWRPHSHFDHTTIVAEDDPHLPTFQKLAADKLIDLRILQAVGCEAVAKFVHDYVSAFVKEQTNDRVWLETVEISEHSGNSASYQLA
jgi:6-pyruvoyltetrahydropterin/6-carboxytetrahydropterin synthase